MAAVKVMIDDTLLDDGSTRQIVGHPYFLSDEAGRMSEFKCEFILHAATAAAFDTLYDSTFDGLELLNPRLRYWQDSSTVLPTVDWFPGDGKHFDIVSSITILADESRTQRKIHCMLSVVAMKQLDLSPTMPPATGSAIAGLSSKIEVTKLYLDSERYTLSAAGSFKSVLNPSVEGPYDLASVSSSGGKARFTLEAPDVIVAAFAAADRQFIDVSSPSAYAGRHFIRAISGGGAIIDTTTAFVSVEGDVNATVLYGDTTSADEAFQAAKSLICTTILETGANGSPSSTEPYMVKTSESLAYSSEIKDSLDFVLVSQPSPMITTAVNLAGQAVERGLMFTVQYIPVELWDDEFAPAPVGVVIQGKTAILQGDLDENTLDQWWAVIKGSILHEVRPTIASVTGGPFHEKFTNVSLDPGTNDVSFTIAGLGNYNGTVSYSRLTTTHAEQPRTVWRNTDGTMPVQEPPGPQEKFVTIRIQWIGESGGQPPNPVPPTESGYTYLFQESGVVQEDNMTDPNGIHFTSRTIDHTYLRIKPVSGEGGQNSGGGFDKDGYFVPSSPDI
jgi:hypothetical protein